MHVIYDGRVMAEQYSGLGRFAGELLFSMLDRNVDGGTRYTVIIWEGRNSGSKNSYYQKLRQYESKGACRVVSVPCRSISLEQHFSLNRFIEGLGGDVYFYPHFDLPIGVRLPSVVVIHDLHPLKCEGYIVTNRFLKILYFKFMLRIAARKAKFIFAVSETTRRDFLEEVGQRFADKVGVSAEGPIVHPISSGPDSLSAPDLPDKFLLYIGGRRPNKNLKRIIDLFVLLKEKTSYAGSLLLAGSTRNYGFDVERYIGKRSDIVITGQVDDNLLMSLYQRMDALVFLSKYEGFGLPVIEASQFRKRIIVSDGGALPEIAPPWVFMLANSADLNDVIFQIEDYLKKPVAFDEDYKRKYTWAITAQRITGKLAELNGPSIPSDVKQGDVESNVIRDFGLEWSRFDQSKLSDTDREKIFKSYFRIFPWSSLTQSAVGADIGCGSGRWASLVAPRVGHLHLIDPSSKAIAVARKNLSNTRNISFHQSLVDSIPLKDASLDFAYSIGVLHHVINSEYFLRSIARLLKPGAPFLIYLYYAFDQRPSWYRSMWRVSDMVRRVVSRMPVFMKNFVCECIAFLVYLPLARTASLLEHFDMLPDAWPLAYYRNHKYYVMRTDSLDRFGTRLEKRFTREDMEVILKSAGFKDIHFSDAQPFWCAVGIKKDRKEY